MSGEENTPDSKAAAPQCQFFVQRKKRLCRMTVKPGRQYCGEHEPQPKTESGQTAKRIPCPNDPKHTCYASKLLKHLAICNARRTEQPPYIIENINAPEAVETCPRLPLSSYPKEMLANVIDKVNHLYAKHVEGNITAEPPSAIHRAVLPEFRDAGRAESSRRHLRQAAALLAAAERAPLPAARSCYVELGAGKGEPPSTIHRAVLPEFRDAGRAESSRRHLRQAAALLAAAERAPLPAARSCYVELGAGKGEPPSTIHRAVLPEFRDAGRAESSRRHLRQAAALLAAAERAPLPAARSCYVELGAGKGEPPSTIHRAVLPEFRDAGRAESSRRHLRQAAALLAAAERAPLPAARSCYVELGAGKGEPPSTIHRAVLPEFRDAGRAESSRRHLRQAAALLAAAERAPLPAARSCYVELGAGKGQLSYYAAHAWCAGTGSRVLAVDRAPLRHKRDNKLRSAPPTPHHTGNTEPSDQQNESDTNRTEAVNVSMGNDNSLRNNNEHIISNNHGTNLQKHSDHSNDRGSTADVNITDEPSPLSESRISNKPNENDRMNASNMTDYEKHSADTENTGEIVLDEVMKDGYEKSRNTDSGNSTGNSKVDTETDKMVSDEVMKDGDEKSKNSDSRSSVSKKGESGVRTVGKTTESDSGEEVAVRLRADLAHLALEAVPVVAEAAAVVGLAKHLCGVATDYALRCIAAPGVLSKTKGLVLATCCHHRAEHSPYVGNQQLQELGINAEEFNIMLGIVSWATCGDGRSRERRLDEETERAGRRQEEREETGRRAKALLDWGRVLWLRERGFHARLCYYVPREVSLENVAIVAVKR